MSNTLSTDKQIAIIAALAEGSSIRGIERMTGVHRDTIMRLGVKIGKGCMNILNEKMVDLPCDDLQLDEIWGFVGKKNKHLKADDDETQLGDVWTFCAVDRQTKAVPCFKVGKRDTATTNAFVGDLASRLRGRAQLSTDGLKTYIDAIDKSFGTEVDYGMIVKSYGTVEESKSPAHRYSQPEVTDIKKYVVMGAPSVFHWLPVVRPARAE